MVRILTTLASACALLFIAPPAGGASGRPNLVLIMADDMGYECLTPNGGRSYQTPRFEQLARDGMRFTHCYSQPVCTPSRVKIMTGRYNFRNYKAFGVLDPNEITFAQVLRAAGYKTCIAGKWQLTGGGPGSRTHDWGTTPARAGFDESCVWAYSHNFTGEQRRQYEASFGSRAKTSRYWHPAILENGEYRPTTRDDYGPDIFTGYILDFIERHQDQRFFVYYPMVLTHGPFLATPHSRVRDETAKFKGGSNYFAGMVAYADFLVGRIRDKLDELGLSENTLLLFTGDNGTARSLKSLLGDRVVHGGKAHPIDAGTHVPLLAYWKGVTAAGTLSDDLVDFSDFLPTLAEAGDAALPEGVRIDGRSFLPRLRGQDYVPRDWIFEHYDRDPNIPKAKWPRVRFARTKRFKLYHDGRLHDVPSDWDEKRPLAPGEGGPEAATARRLLQSALDAMPPSGVRTF